jgi:hypothetical protein
LRIVSLTNTDAFTICDRFCQYLLHTNPQICEPREEYVSKEMLKLLYTPESKQLFTLKPRNVEPIYCVICGVTFTNYETYVAHGCAARGEEPGYCRDCDHKYTSEADLFRHLSRSTTDCSLAKRLPPPETSGEVKSILVDKKLSSRPYWKKRDTIYYGKSHGINQKTSETSQIPRKQEESHACVSSTRWSS